MNWSRFRRLIVMLVVVKVLLHLPHAVLAHPGHGLGGVAASVLLDSALSSEGGCTAREAS